MTPVGRSRETDDCITCCQIGHYCHSICVDRLELGFNSGLAGGTNIYDVAMELLKRRMSKTTNQHSRLQNCIYLTRYFIDYTLITNLMH